MQTANSDTSLPKTNKHLGDETQNEAASSNGIVVVVRGGRWRGVETTYAKKDTNTIESSINTLKSTMAHRECSSAVNQYNQVKQAF